MSTLTHPSMSFSRGRRGRAASLKQVLRQRLARWGAGLWAALESAGRLHAASALLEEARLHEQSNPGLAASLRELARPPSIAARAITPARRR